MRPLRLKLFCFCDDMEIFKEAHGIKRLVEEYHGQTEPSPGIKWGKKWYVMYYPTQPETEDYLQSKGCILIPHHTDPSPVGEEIISLLPAGHNLTPAHSGFHVIKHMSQFLSAVWRPTTY